MIVTIKKNQLDELGERSRLRAQCDEKHGWRKQFWQHRHEDASLIKRGFKNKTKEIMLPLYKSMVRPHHHHHLFLNRSFPPCSARVRRLPRYEVSTYP